MKRITSVLLVIVVLFGFVGPTLADDNGGTPPTCDRPTTQSAIQRAATELKSDRANEHVIFVDCLTNWVVLDESNGGPYLTTIHYTPWQTSNEAMILYHPIGGNTMRFEDMQAIRDMNPLLVYVLAYDLETQSFSACTYTKAAWDQAWPEINVNQAYADYQDYYAAQSGTFYRRTIDAHQTFWEAWSARNGIGFNCE